MHIVFATHEELHTCRVSGHDWVWIKLIEAQFAPWIDEVQYECNYCGETQWVEL